MKKYDVAAFIWPAYTGDEERTRIFWPEGIGEWQTVKNIADTLANKPGYHWDRKPLFGYGYLEAVKRVFCEEQSYVNLYAIPEGADWDILRY